MEGRHLNIRFLIATACLAVYLSIGANSQAEELAKAPVGNSLKLKKYEKKSLESNRRLNVKFTSEFDNEETEVKKREKMEYSINSQVNLARKAHTQNSEDAKNKKVNLGTLVKQWSVNFKSESIPTNINKKVLGVELMYKMRF